MIKRFRGSEVQGSRFRVTLNFRANEPAAKILSGNILNSPPSSS
jgi:hypothetical protein